MGWMYTFLATLGELVMILGLKQHNRAVVVLSIATSALITGFFLNRALHLLDSSIVYPVWVSLGSLCALLMGAFIYKEKPSIAQLCCMILLITGCAGLSLGK